ncbi:MAG: transposase domain-containing protein [Phycisphaeraceae bacterium]|nr:transposase domain-containing protein [Phycisphaeraceae bacterium]
MMLNIGNGSPIRAIGSSDAQQVVFEALARYIRPDQIETALRRTGRGGQRVRKLPPRAMVWLVIAIGLWGELDIPSLWRQVVGTLRSLWRVATGRSPPTKSALCQARERLGPRPVRQLFVQVSAPLANDGSWRSPMMKSPPTNWPGP